MDDELSEKDQNNLRFLLTAPHSVLARWWATASPEDTVYATTLLEIARLRAIDLAVEKIGAPDGQILCEYIRQRSKS